MTTRIIKILPNPAQVTNKTRSKGDGLLTLGVTFVLSGSVIPSVNAQIFPDGTLPSNSVITKEGNIQRITSGTQAGGNLFHSFQEFSLPTGETAWFDNAATVENIITRVTGGNISQIDGLIKANGNASLFLINPNGIVFGANASLNIGGSFIGSTASSIKFADGMEYSAINPETPPLLTVNVPLGLQFGGNPNSPGEIRVMGGGHDFKMPLAPLKILAIEGAGESETGLRVNPGQTLALIGGDVILAGGILTAPGGRIELGSVAAGVVNLTAPHPATAAQWQFGYEQVENFRNIQLNSLAAVDASGAVRGAIQVQGGMVTLADGSVILMQNQGEQANSSLRLIASQGIEISGTTPDGAQPSGLFNQTVAAGSGGDVDVTTQNLRLEGGAMISAATYSPGRGGNLTVNVAENINIVGFSPINRQLSQITARSFDAGDAGDINIFTKSLTGLNGGFVVSLAHGAGGGGNVTVKATDLVEMRGISPLTFQASVIAASSIGAGDAGKLTLDTSRLILGDGGVVSSSALASGDSGGMTINARKSVEVSGSVPGSANPSALLSGAIIVEPVRQELLGIGPVPSGASGSIIINTPVLRVTDKGQVAARNDGTGNGGDIRINAREVFLADQGRLTAATNFGGGGNINLQTASLQLRGGGFITATAGANGNGGNINIDADIIAALENSDITANAVAGAGGNIQITSQGIFGTEFRPFPTANSDITAASQFGVSGTVTINNPDTNPSSGLDKLPANVIDASQMVTVSCAAAEGNSFTVTGRGGLPENPLEPLRGQILWEDMRVISPLESRYGEQRRRGDGETRRPGDGEQGSRGPFDKLRREQGSRGALEQGRDRGLIEATGWVVHPDGTVNLVAEAISGNGSKWAKYPSCEDLSGDLYAGVW